MQKTKKLMHIDDVAGDAKRDMEKAMVLMGQLEKKCFNIIDIHKKIPRDLMGTLKEEIYHE